MNKNKKTIKQKKSKIHLNTTHCEFPLLFPLPCYYQYSHAEKITHVGHYYPLSNEGKRIGSSSHSSLKTKRRLIKPVKTILTQRQSSLEVLEGIPLSNVSDGREGLCRPKERQHNSIILAIAPQISMKITLFCLEALVSP